MQKDPKSGREMGGKEGDRMKPVAQQGPTSAKYAGAVKPMAGGKLGGKKK